MHFIQIFVEDIINPLLVIAFGFFVGIGYLLSTLFPMTITDWVTVLYVCVAITFWGLVARLILNRKRYSLRGFFDIRVILPLIPLVIFVPAIQGEFAPDPMLQILSHGDIHLGYIHQIMNGTTPLDNVFIAGYPANYYWLYHAFIGALAQITGFKAAFVAAAVNIVALVSTLLWMGKTLVALNLIKHRTLMVGLLAVFVMFSVNIAGVLHGGTGLLDEPYNLDLLRTMLADGADRRLHSVLPKFFEFTSTSIGFVLVSAAVYACVKLIQNNYDFLYLFLISAAGIGTLAVQQMAVMYIVGALLVSTIIIFFVSLFLNKDNRSIDFSLLFKTLKHPLNILTLLVWLGISLVLSVPLLQYNGEISYNYDVNSLLNFSSFDNLPMIIWALYALIPFYILHIFMMAWKPRADQMFIVLSTILSIILTIGLSFVDANQYKGVYIIAPLMAISTLCVLRALQTHANLLVRVAGYCILLIVLFLSFTSVGYVSFYLYNQPEEQAYKGFAYQDDGLNFIYEGDKRIPAYIHIRRNTPAESVVITPNSILRFTHIVYERPSYVRLGQFDFTTNIDEHPIRVENIDQFYEGEDLSFEQYQIIYNQFIESIPDRTIYAVIKDKEVSQDIMEQLGAVQVYTHRDDDGAHVYLLNPN